MAGKGSKPRSCFSKQFKNNFDQINWSSSSEKAADKHVSSKKGKTIIKYKDISNDNRCNP